MRMYFRILASVMSHQLTRREYISGFDFFPVYFNEKRERCYFIEVVTISQTQSLSRINRRRQEGMVANHCFLAPFSWPNF